MGACAPRRAAPGQPRRPWKRMQTRAGGGLARGRNRLWVSFSACGQDSQQGVHAHSAAPSLQPTPVSTTQGLSCRVLRLSTSGFELRNKQRMDRGSHAGRART